MPPKRRALSNLQCQETCKKMLELGPHIILRFPLHYTLRGTSNWYVVSWPTECIVTCSIPATQYKSRCTRPLLQVNIQIHCSTPKSLLSCAPNSDNVDIEVTFDLSQPTVTFSESALGTSLMVTTMRSNGHLWVPGNCPCHFEMPK